MSKFRPVGKAFGACAVMAIIGAVLANYSDRVNVSEQALELIGNAEGCKREPYHCPANILTVGIGSTAAGGEPIIPNKVYSDTEIADRWSKDIQTAQQCVESYAVGQQPIPQSVYDALVSITFNAGCGALKKSTLFRYSYQGNYTQACNEFPKWVYGGGKKLPGLVNRRNKERALCLQDLNATSH